MWDWGRYDEADRKQERIRRLTSREELRARSAPRKAVAEERGEICGALRPGENRWGDVTRDYESRLGALPTKAEIPAPVVVVGKPAPS